MQQKLGIQHVEKILMHLPIAPSVDAIRGITWLELYALFRLSGHPKLVTNEADPAMAKLSLVTRSASGTRRR